MHTTQTIDLERLAEVMVSPIENREAFELQKFNCGCLWDGVHIEWRIECPSHKGTRPEDCRCLTVGKEDGGTTCWQHHDCGDGSCTHGE